MTSITINDSRPLMTMSYMPERDEKVRGWTTGGNTLENQKTQCRLAIKVAQYLADF